MHANFKCAIDEQHCSRGKGCVYVATMTNAEKWAFYQFFVSVPIPFGEYCNTNIKCIRYRVIVIYLHFIIS